MHKFRVLSLAPALALIALIAWALASPVGSSPDDDFHLASIWCADSAKTSACLPGATADERIVPAAVHYSSCYARDPLKSAACEAKYLQKDSRPSVMTSRGNFQHNYPPLYYATMSILVGPDIAAAVLAMRLANILLLIGMTTALFLLLPRPRRSTLLWGWILSTMPLGLFLLASNNPSSWAMTGIGSAWIALLGYFETKGRRKVGLGAVFALAALIAAGSRGDAALYLVLSVVVVVILSFVKGRNYLVSGLLPFAVSVIALFLYSSTQQSGVIVTGMQSGDGTGDSSAFSVPTLIIKNLINVPGLWAGIFGGRELGWEDTSMPAVVSLGGISAFVAITFVGLSRLSVRKVAALIVVALALWLIPTYVSVKSMVELGSIIQPRYLLPLMILFAGLTMLSVGRGKFDLSRAQLLVVVGLLALAQSIALYMDMRRYLTGIGGHGLNLDASVQWWWDISISPMAVWAIGSLAYTALLVLLAREMNKPNAIQ